jgi:hypothetical protein
LRRAAVCRISRNGINGNAGLATRLDTVGEFKQRYCFEIFQFGCLVSR